MGEKHLILYNSNRLKESWRRYQNSGEHALFKAILHAFRKDFMIAFMGNLTAACLDMLSPFIIKGIMHYIQDPVANLSYGLLLVAALVVSQLLGKVVLAQATFY